MTVWSDLKSDKKLGGCVRPVRIRPFLENDYILKEITSTHY